MKLTRFREDYSDVKKKFKKIEDRFNTEEDRHKMNNFNASGVSIIEQLFLIEFLPFRQKKSLILISKRNFWMEPALL